MRWFMANAQRWRQLHWQDLKLNSVLADWRFFAAATCVCESSNKKSSAAFMFLDGSDGTDVRLNHIPQLIHGCFLCGRFDGLQVEWMHDVHHNITQEHTILTNSGLEIAVRSCHRSRLLNTPDWLQMLSGLRTSDLYCIAGNLRARKLSRISWFCGYSWKFSLQTLGRGILWREQSTSFLRENRIFNQSAKVFSLESFPLYGMQKEIGLYPQL